MAFPVTQLTRLAAAAGANVSSGQTVVVSAKLGQETPARQIAAACNDRGAHHVQVDYSDRWVSRARYQRAPEEALGTVMDDPPKVLWANVATICRLDEPDSEAARRQRSVELRQACERLQLAGLDALRFRGPGTDLRVGLLPGIRWHGGGMRTAWGRDHLPNLPTEEVFTSPDPERMEGIVTSTKLGSCRFMIGGTDVEISGSTRDGREIPVLIRGEWAL